MKKVTGILIFLFIFIPQAVSGSALSDAAAALAPGESALFPQGLNTIENNRLNIQWQTVAFYYDSIRKEAQYMGKPASGQSTNHAHFIYDEATSQWRTTGQTLFPGTGHIWTCTFDPGTGDYFFCKSGETYVRHMFREHESWGATRPDANLLKYLGMTTHGAMCWHPNLFGQGQAGIVFLGIAYMSGWRASDNTWHLIKAFSSGTDTWALSGGQGCYLPNMDAAVVTAVSSSAHPLLKVGAGSNGSVTRTITNLGNTPLRIHGGGGTTNCGKMLNDPNDPNRLLIIERCGTDRVWTSEDGGDNWTLAAFKHPIEAAFENTGSSSYKEWTAGTVAPYDVIWGLNSHIPLSVLWKPPTASSTVSKKGVMAQNSGLLITASPNPFRTAVTIHLANGVGANNYLPLPQLAIYDIHGRMVHRVHASHTTWDASGLPSGVYLIKAFAHGKTLTRRIMLQR
jgi:hypothetical protein